MIMIKLSRIRTSSEALQGLCERAQSFGVAADHDHLGFAVPLEGKHVHAPVQGET
jgi:hypothetical protein